MPKVGMISLGCAKNQVDGEMLMASLACDGFQLSDDVGVCDIAIVNTCGFIESAKKESIDEILELAQLKQEGRIKKIVVTGCLAERYKDEIMKSIPEADAVIGIGANGNISTLLKDLLKDEKIEVFPDKYDLPLSGDRVLTTPSYFAYLKIAEGCNHRCSFCAIPLIRGGFRSRPMDNIIAEANKLVDNGAKELILIAQDTSMYGVDLYKEFSLAKLLKELCKIEKLKWVRIMYCYPDTVTDELIDTIATEEKIVKYIDMPLQHANGRILKNMRRKGDRQSLTEMINKMKAKIPGLIFRTTFIVGFPGETEEEFSELCEFAKEMKFDKMGCFAYSREEDTKAAEMDDQIDEDVKYHRAEILTEMQMRIMEEKGDEYIGKTLDVLVEGFDRYAECMFGRSYMDAPDVDGKVFFTAENKPPFGSFVKVKITEAMDSDLMGELI